LALLLFEYFISFIDPSIATPFAFVKG